jgi:hypothetical protein
MSTLIETISMRIGTTSLYRGLAVNALFIISINLFSLK